MQLEEPQDLVIGTGKPASVRDFVEEAFTVAGLDYRSHVRFDERYLRPTEVQRLEADPKLAVKLLDLQNLIDWRALAKLMTEHDIVSQRDQRQIDKPQSPLWQQETDS